MSGLRFISIVFALVAAFFWSSFVLHQWQTNLSNRDATALKTAADKKAAQIAEATLDRADEMAIAASEEFSKRIDPKAEPKGGDKKLERDQQDVAALTDKKLKVDEKPGQWKVPDGVTPQYDEAKASKVGKQAWEVPTGEDPVYVTRVANNIITVADQLKDDASNAAETVGETLTQFAETVTGALISETWKVPTGNAPDYEMAVTEKTKSKKWEVPTGNDPHYDEGRVELALKDETKLSDVQRPVKAKDGAVINKISDTEISVTGKIKSVAAGDKKVLKIAKLDARLGSEKKAAGEKDVARLTKDLKAVPARKYSWTVPTGNTPDYDERQLAAVRKESVWSVPTGETPDYGVVDQLERGLEKVKDVATSTGSEIAEQVSELGSNLKGAIAAPEKWKVPTGVTPKGEEIQVATLDDKDAPVGKVVNSKEVVKGQDKQGVYISSEIKPENEAPIRLAEAKGDKSGDGTFGNKDGDTKQTGDSKSGVISRIIDFFSDDKDVAKKDGVISDKSQRISKGDQLRFEANKTLMIDEVNYKFTNVRKGKGKLEFSGRAQPSAKLLLYTGPRYLGEVVASGKGTWSFSREMYLPKGKHIVHAQQVTKGGLVLVRKSLPLVQARNVKPPKGYKASTGLGLGDAALTKLNEKLGNKKKKSEKTTKVAARKVAPLPVRKSAKDKARLAALEEAKKAKEKARLAALEKAKKAKAKEKARLAAEAKAKAKEKARLAAEAKAKKAKEKARLAAEAKAKAKEKARLAAEAKAKAKEKARLAAEKKAKLKQLAALDNSDKSKGKKVETAKTAKKAQPRYYVVKRNDTLLRIAIRVYGKASRYPELVKLNPKLLKNPNRIYPRQKLLVATGATKIAAKDKSSGLKVAAKTKKKDNKAAKGKYYLVKPGDSLWTIAKKVYGKGSRYKEIIRLNPTGLKNPSKIKPKQKLLVSAS